MPELPEVETVRRGLAPAMDGARIADIILHRANLRYPFPEKFCERVQGKRIDLLERRAKYLIAHLDSRESLIMHLGMSGRFMVLGQGTPGQYVHQVSGEKHIHVTFRTVGGTAGQAEIYYADPRRFGFMDLVPTSDIESCSHFKKMGPEPMSEAFTTASLFEALKGKKASIKQALLDQRVVAGLGNIYVCEALFRAGIAPRWEAGKVSKKRLERLVPIVKDVLREAIEVGGSTLRDHAAADGTMGAFQHRFLVYNREGQACYHCGHEITRMVQSGRSTFYCGTCQR